MEWFRRFLNAFSAKPNQTSSSPPTPAVLEPVTPETAPPEVTLAVVEEVSESSPVAPEPARPVVDTEEALTPTVETPVRKEAEHSVTRVALVGAKGKSVTSIIQLGSVDADVGENIYEDYFNAVTRITDVAVTKVFEDIAGFSVTTLREGLDRIKHLRRAPAAADSMTIREVQNALNVLGFFPGGETDGICGYRTEAAIRLFQEYVRTVEGLACLPDGQFGPLTNKHLQRHLEKGVVADWGQKPEEYALWLSLVVKAKHHHQSTPTRFDKLVNNFAGETSTRKTADWEGDGPSAIHLIGVRRQDQFGDKYDDMFVLLMKGLVFKFQGSTQAVLSDHRQGVPHLVPGQHDYQFGYHNKTYLALRPAGFIQGRGVLVARAGDDGKLTDEDLDNGLESNVTINIHWGGLGEVRDLKYWIIKKEKWSAWTRGCQVINGAYYISPADALVSCKEFATGSPSDAEGKHAKSRGAYTVLADLVTALSGDMSTSTVIYTLLEEADLALVPECETQMNQARERLLNALGVAIA